MAIPLDLRLDHSGGHYRKHPGPLVDQIARTALVVDAASCHCLDHCFPPVARLLEICPEPLLQRELVTQPPWLSRQPGILPAKPQCRLAACTTKQAQMPALRNLRLRDLGNVLN